MSSLLSIGDHRVVYTDDDLSVPIFFALPKDRSSFESVEASLADQWARLGLPEADIEWLLEVVWEEVLNREVA